MRGERRAAIPTGRSRLLEAGPALMLAVLLLCLPPALSGLKGGETEGRVPLPVRETLAALERDEDTDGDRRITVNDSRRAEAAGRGDKRFTARAVDGRRLEVAGTYYLSNLLQELKLAEEAGRDTLLADPARIFELPVERISRNISDRYWDDLTRRIDERGLPRMLKDEKTRSDDGHQYIYVPASDARAAAYFRGVAGRHPDWKARVVEVPRGVPPDFLRALEGRQGLLTLALSAATGGDTSGIPFVVPGGRFNEMYGWDSYFIVLGLLKDGRRELARGMVDNMVYEIDHYGAILNANRTYYLTRSQPPFLTSMARAVFRELPKDPASVAWLAGVLRAAIREYTTVWMSPARLTPIGLSRYFDRAGGAPPEVEPGHFDPVFRPLARKHRMSVRQFERAYRAGRIREAALDSFFVHDRSMRESGHDTSYRLLGRSADLATVDLNALLYRIETDVAELIAEVFDGRLAGEGGPDEEAEAWRARAARRKDLIDRYLWDAARGMYFDYDYRSGRRSDYLSATTLYPLWAGLASKEQAALLVARALPQLEMPGGIVSSTEASRGPLSAGRPARQWDYPNGWAPHQMLAWLGLSAYDYNAEARRLAYRWLYMITRNAVDYNGTIPEKYDVVRRTHEVFAEYGNVGTKFAYITREGFGWTNASFQIGRGLLSAPLAGKLDALIPPEWIEAW